VYLGDEDPQHDGERDKGAEREGRCAACTVKISICTLKMSICTLKISARIAAPPVQLRLVYVHLR